MRNLWVFNKLFISGFLLASLFSLLVSLVFIKIHFTVTVQINTVLMSHQRKEDWTETFESAAAND